MHPPYKPDWYKVNYDQLMKELAEINKGERPQDIEPILKKIKILEEFSPDKKRIFCLFSHADFFPIYLSDNVKAYGYSPEELYDRGTILVFSNIHWKHLTMAFKVNRWGARFHKHTSQHLPITNDEVYFCGMRFKNRKGEWRTFFMKQKILSSTKNNKALLSFLEVVDITHIYKGDFYWGRLTNTTDNLFYCRVYFSNKSKAATELLSSRELEILKLLAEQKKNTEISELLGITKDTIKRHRKNMIAKVGAIDMTGVIQLCKLCQLI